MSDPTDPLTCTACAVNRALIEQLDERLTALELEVRGAPAELLLEEFATAKARRDAKQAAIDDYRRAQEEEFFKRLPELKEASIREKAKYEAFMRDRGFKP